MWVLLGLINDRNEAELEVLHVEYTNNKCIPHPVPWWHRVRPSFLHRQQQVQRAWGREEGVRGAQQGLVRGRHGERGQEPHGRLCETVVTRSKKSDFVGSWCLNHRLYSVYSRVEVAVSRLEEGNCWLWWQHQFLAKFNKNLTERCRKVMRRYLQVRGMMIWPF